MGAYVDRSLNNGNGPPVFTISGQVCHRIGSLLRNYMCMTLQMSWPTDSEQLIEIVMALAVSALKLLLVL
jgi:hypothetical protein